MSRNPIATGAEPKSIVDHCRATRFADLRVVIAIEDESARRQLYSILVAEDGINVVAQTGDALRAADRIKNSRPDLVFLDMEMQDLERTDIIDNLNQSPRLVLTSAFHQQAVRAFDACALDFLLRPFGADRVRQTISRARAVLASKRRTTPSADLFAAADRRLSPRVSRLAVHRGKRVLLLSLKDIIYLKVENRLIFAFTDREQYMLNRTIAELEELLRHEGFFQINRATIINLDYLLEIVPWFSGAYRLRMANDVEFQLSRDRVSALKTRVGLPGRWSGK